MSHNVHIFSYLVWYTVRERVVRCLQEPVFCIRYLECGTRFICSFYLRTWRQVFDIINALVLRMDEDSRVVIQKMLHKVDGCLRDDEYPWSTTQYVSGLCEQQICWSCFYLC